MNFHGYGTPEIRRILENMKYFLTPKNLWFLRISEPSNAKRLGLSNAKHSEHRNYKFRMPRNQRDFDGTKIEDFC